MLPPSSGYTYPEDGGFRYPETVSQADNTAPYLSAVIVCSFRLVSFSKMTLPCLGFRVTSFFIDTADKKKSLIPEILFCLLYFVLCRRTSSSFNWRLCVHAGGTEECHVTYC